MAAKPITVLFVEAPPLAYGSSRSLLSLMTNLDRSLVTPVLACNRENDLLQWARNEGIVTFPLSLPGLPSEAKLIFDQATRTSSLGAGALSPTWMERVMVPARNMRDAHEFRIVRAEMLKIIDEKQVDILHLNNQVSTNRFAYAFSPRMKIIQHVRDAPLSRSLHVSKLARQAERVIAISRYVAGDAALAYGREITDVVANPIDIALTFSCEKRAKWRSEWGIPDDTLLFGQAGRFVDWKGADTAIEVYSKLCDDAEFRRSTRLVLVGSSADRSEYLEKCKRLIGKLPLGQIRIEAFSDDAAGLFSAFDVTLHPIRKPEGFGRVIIESMACRSVPIARDLGAIGDLITHQVDGILFAKTESLYEAMRELHRSPERLKSLSDAGFETAKRYRAADIARKIEAIYRELISA